MQLKVFLILKTRYKMNKKVLILSDNFDLVSHVKELENKIQLSASINYFYSVNNSNPNKLLQLGMESLDLNEDITVEKICSTYDVVFSIHCKQIFPTSVIEKICCINVHPGLNPYNRGWYPQVFSIINKKPIGCTVHLMTDEIDHGAIIYQEEISIEDFDTSLDVYTKIVNLEKEILSKYFEDLITGNYNTFNPQTHGNYNSIKNFDDLRRLDLDMYGTLGEHIDLLRATTHGNFDNAYFYDSKGQKIFVKIKFTKNKK